MECLTWMAPVLPGKLDKWRSFSDQMNGPAAPSTTPHASEWA